MIFYKVEDFLPYDETFQYQKELLKKRQEGLIDDSILLLEHKKVITIGNRGLVEGLLSTEMDLKKNGFDLVQSDRGGDLTYHGPGQLIVYFIVDIHNYSKGVKDFFYLLEEIVIRHLRLYNIEGSRKSEYPGIWVGENKICAIGCAIKKGISMHGLGYNINTNLLDFQNIVPCGIRDKGVTSLRVETNNNHLEMDKIKDECIKIIEDILQIKGTVKRWNKENQIG